MGDLPELKPDWRETAAAAPEYLSLIDEAFRLVYVNHADPSAIGRPIFDFVAAEYHDAFRTAVRDARSHLLPQHFESIVSRLNGERSYYSNWIIALTGPSMSGLYAMISADVTHSQRVEAALDASESLLRSVMENAPDHLTVVDRAYRMLFVSRLRSGRAPDTVVGQSVLDFVPEDHVERVRAAIDSVFETREHASYDLELEPDGAIYHTRLGPVLEKGRVDRVTLISTDVTAQRRAEAERAQLSEQLFRSQKMEALGKLTGGIAHDFNNLLTVILACVELIDTDPDDTELAAEGLTQIRGATLRAADLTRHLLAFARRQALAPRACDLNALVSEERPMLERALGEQVHVTADLEPALWTCRVDAGQLQSALLNIAINARDAFPLASGTVAIRSRNFAVAEGEVGAIPEGEWIELEIRDDGAGMSADIERQALEPFFTTKGERGTGLGLSTVYGFVRQSGGHLVLESEEGIGTSVRLYFPRAHDSTPTPPSGTSTGGGPTGERILLVEDDPSVRRTTRRLIERLGYQARTAKDAIEAIEVIEDSFVEGAPFAVVVTDVVLPRGMDGLRLRTTIQDRWPRIEVVVVSGYATDALTDVQALDPTLRIVEKPFSKDRLDAELREALARHKSRP